MRTNDEIVESAGRLASTAADVPALMTATVALLQRERPSYTWARIIVKRI